MIQLTGTVRNGKIEVAAPSELADGARVAMHKCILGSQPVEPAIGELT